MMMNKMALNVRKILIKENTTVKMVVDGQCNADVNVITDSKD